MQSFKFFRFAFALLIAGSFAGGCAKKKSPGADLGEIRNWNHVFHSSIDTLNSAYVIISHHGKDSGNSQTSFSPVSFGFQASDMVRQTDTSIQYNIPRIYSSKNLLYYIRNDSMCIESSSSQVYYNTATFMVRLNTYDVYSTY